MSCAQSSPFWTDTEKKQIQAFWTQKGRNEATSKPNFVVRLTTAGSVWLWEYNRKRGKSKVPPSQVPVPASEQEITWEKWIDAKVAFDRYNAYLEVSRRSNSPATAAAVADPGPPPSDIVSQFGEPPIFANAVQPVTHKINFKDTSLSYEDNVDMRPRYAYYRFEYGVASEGKKMKSLPPTEVDSILAQAGINSSEANVFNAVSLLEGGFDSVNTYDTGFVSVGFIQFASLKDGSHSLGQTLLQYKLDDPANFSADFRTYGIDVDPKGNLVALDINCLLETVGAGANQQIIRDKWLIATFQRAGQRTPYRLAQLKVAKRMYWPLADVFTVNINGKEIKDSLFKVFKTEAGAAILLDRKVNTGGYGPLRDVLQAVIDAKGVRSVDELSKYEALLIECLYYRFNPAKDDSLNKPAPCEMVPDILKKYRPS
jgi:hypothetical protein